MIDYENLTYFEHYRLCLARSLRLNAFMQCSLSWQTKKPSEIKEYACLANFLPPAIRPEGDRFYQIYQDWD